LFPIEFLRSPLDGRSQTHREDGRSYWHIQIHREGGRWIPHRRKEEAWPDITQLMLIT